MLVLTMKLKRKSIKTRMKMSRDDENWDKQIIDEDKENEGKDGKNNEDDDEGSVFSALLLAPFYY